MTDKKMLKAGFARQIINPPKGILTIGFGNRFNAIIHALKRFWLLYVSRHKSATMDAYS